MVFAENTIENLYIAFPVYRYGNKLQFLNAYYIYDWMIQLPNLRMINNASFREFCPSGAQNLIARGISY